MNATSISDSQNHTQKNKPLVHITLVIPGIDYWIGSFEIFSKIYKMTSSKTRKIEANIDKSTLIILITMSQLGHKHWR